MSLNRPIIKQTSSSSIKQDGATPHLSALLRSGKQQIVTDLVRIISNYFIHANMQVDYDRSCACCIWENQENCDKLYYMKRLNLLGHFLNFLQASLYKQFITYSHKKH